MQILLKIAKANSMESLLHFKINVRRITGLIATANLEIQNTENC